MAGKVIMRTSALMQKRNSSLLIFVTFMGARYHVMVQKPKIWNLTLAMGLGADCALPTQHSCVA